MDVISFEEDRVLAVRRWNQSSEILGIFNFNDQSVQLSQNIPLGVWLKLLDSSDSRWLGPGANLPDRLDARQAHGIALQPQAVVLFEKELDD
jgi:maltooligosyltrehalose trehalohydrolase